MTSIFLGAVGDGAPGLLVADTADGRLAALAGPPAARRAMPPWPRACRADAGGAAWSAGASTGASAGARRPPARRPRRVVCRVAGPGRDRCGGGGAGLPGRVGVAVLDLVGWVSLVGLVVVGPVVVRGGGQRGVQRLVGGVGGGGSPLEHLVGVDGAALATAARQGPDPRRPRRRPRRPGPGRRSPRRDLGSATTSPPSASASASARRVAGAVSSPPSAMAGTSRPAQAVLGVGVGGAGREEHVVVGDDGHALGGLVLAGPAPAAGARTTGARPGTASSPAWAATAAAAPASRPIAPASGCTSRSRPAGSGVVHRRDGGTAGLGFPRPGFRRPGPPAARRGGGRPAPRRRRPGPAPGHHGGEPPGPPPPRRRPGPGAGAPRRRAPGPPPPRRRPGPVPGHHGGRATGAATAASASRSGAGAPRRRPRCHDDAGRVRPSAWPATPSPPHVQPARGVQPVGGVQPGRGASTPSGASSSPGATGRSDAGAGSGAAASMVGAGPALTPARPGAAGVRPGGDLATAPAGRPRGAGRGLVLGAGRGASAGHVLGGGHVVGARAGARPPRRRRGRCGDGTGAPSSAPGSAAGARGRRARTGAASSPAGFCAGARRARAGRAPPPRPRPRSGGGSRRPARPGRHGRRCGGRATRTRVPSQRRVDRRLIFVGHGGGTSRCPPGRRRRGDPRQGRRARGRRGERPGAPAGARGTRSAMSSASRTGERRPITRCWGGGGARPRGGSRADGGPRVDCPDASPGAAATTRRASAPSSVAVDSPGCKALPSEWCRDGTRRPVNWLARSPRATGGERWRARNSRKCTARHRITAGSGR